jgi:hypothetical protein
MNTITTHSLLSLDGISQRDYDAQRPGQAVPLAAHLGSFEETGQYLLALDMLKDAALVISLDPEGSSAQDELDWLADSTITLLPASRCFEVLSDLLHVEDASLFQQAFVSAVKKDPDAMYRALRSLMKSMEAGHTVGEGVTHDAPYVESGRAEADASMELPLFHVLQGLNDPSWASAGAEPGLESADEDASSRHAVTHERAR